MLTGELTRVLSATSPLSGFVASGKYSNAARCSRSSSASSAERSMRSIQQMLLRLHERGLGSFFRAIHPLVFPGLALRHVLGHIIRMTGALDPARHLRRPR